MTIDSHVHVWDLDRARYPWLTPDIGDLYRTIDFSEIEPELAARGIDGAILVQASDEAADTAVMLDAAARHPAIVGVVAFTPLESPDQVARDLAEFADQPLIVGVRNLVHERPPGWMRLPSFVEGLVLLADHGLPLDVPTATFHALADVAWVGAQLPGLAIVVDHLGKPPIGGSADERREWRAMLSDCAQNPRTVAKVSGLYASRGALDSWTVDQVRPFVDDALEIFGAERLLYGGDWPIADLAGGYARTWDAVSACLAAVSDADRAEVLEGTARRVYLGERRVAG